MQQREERPEGTIRVYFADNTYKTLPVKSDTTADDVIEWLCKKLSSGARQLDPARHEIFIVVPGTQALRERQLDRQEELFDGKAQSGAQAFKFIFREVVPVVAAADADTDGCAPDESTTVDSSTAASTSTTRVVEAAESALAAHGGSGGAATASSMVPDVGAALRTGAMERPMQQSSQQGPGKDGIAWYPCTVILTEERLWYSEAPVLEGGGVGGGMVSLALRETDRVMECEDKRQLRILAKGGALTLRARSGAERTSWLLAIAKQAAFVKERGILDEAEHLIASLEERQADYHASCLEAFEHLEGVASTRETRDLLLDFARRELEEAARSDGADNGAGGTETLEWPAGVNIEALTECLERRSLLGSDEAEAHLEQDEAIWAFAASTLLPRLQTLPGYQAGLCRIAAGIT